MLENVYRLVSSLEVQQQKQELTAQNIAGANMPGFKGRHIHTNSFEREMAIARDEADLSGFGVTASDEMTNFADGPIKNTQRALDFAVSGDGFFKVQTPDDKILLTRDGRFHLSADGQLKTNEGYNVMGQNGPITLPTDVSLNTLSVSDEGVLESATPQGERQEVGTLDIGTVENKNDLQRLSGKYYKPAENQDVQNAENVSLNNKCYEDANVSAIREMTEMIQTTRRFEMGHKMISMFRQLSQQENRKMN